MDQSASSVSSGSFRETVWPKLRSFIGGYASGMALIAVGHPFDTIKVRLQTDSTKRFSGPLNCVVETFKKEGVRGFYKGVTPPLFATGVINSVMFGLNAIMLSSVIKKDANRPTTLFETCLAGSMTGICISFIVTPIEGIKARLQVQYNSLKSPNAAAAGGAKLYAGPIDCAKRVYQNLGLMKGIYRGWVPTAFCRFSNYAYFGPYEYVRQRFVQESNGERKLSPLASAMAGASAGVCYWLSCYPVDVIKNRMQAAPDVSPPLYPTVRYTAKVIYQEGGVRAFFKGFTPAIIRAVPANIACFSVFELVMYLLPQ